MEKLSWFAYIHPQVYRYAQVDVPCRQTIIRRIRVELHLTVTLKKTLQIPTFPVDIHF